MTNAEKYLKDNVSVGEMHKEYNQTGQRSKSVFEWLTEEAKPTLTEDERVILRNIKVKGRKAEYIKRTANTGYLQVYSRSGVVGADFANIDIYSHIFQFIKERRRI